VDGSVGPGARSNPSAAPRDPRRLYIDTIDISYYINENIAAGRRSPSDLSRATF
jgi:hypothetical protein